MKNIDDKIEEIKFTYKNKRKIKEKMKIYKWKKEKRKIKTTNKEYKKNR